MRDETVTLYACVILILINIILGLAVKLFDIAMGLFTVWKFFVSIVDTKVEEGRQEVKWRPNT